jgi:hypothetical protein
VAQIENLAAGKAEEDETQDTEADAPVSLADNFFGPLRATGNIMTQRQRRSTQLVFRRGVAEG